MQLYDLMAKLKKIEEGVEPPNHYGGQGPEGAKFDLYMQQRKNQLAAQKPKEESVEECGEGPLPMIAHAQQSQQDNVSMNVTMSGQGSGGIKDLMSILRNIENGSSEKEPAMIIGKDSSEHDHEEPMMGDMVASMSAEEGQSDMSPLTTDERGMEEEFDDDEETYGNSAQGSAGHHVHGVDAVTFSGDDMNSKGKISPIQRAVGTNPLREPSNFDESLVNKLSAMYEEVKQKSMSRKSEKMSKKDVKENAHHDDDEEKKIRHLMRKYGWSHQEALEHYHYEEHDPKDYEDMEESAKWRDPKYKGQLFTQKKGDSDDYDSIDYGYGIKERPKKDPGQKRSTFDRDTVWTDPLDTRSNLPKHHNDPENWGHGSISSKGDSKGKLTADRRKRMKNDIRGSLGQHHTPTLPEQMNESKELNAMLALNKRLNG